MGASYKFNLNSFIEKYNLDNYAETGIGKLDSFKFALQCNFKQYFGVDLDEDLYKDALSWLQNNTGKSFLIECDYSIGFLSKLAPELVGNTLWFIDSHFPGKCDFGGISQDESLRLYKQNALPLLDELKVLTSLRDTSSDLILIDDLCLYVNDVEHESKSVGCIWRHANLQKELGLNTNLEQILSFFPDRKWEIDLRDQAYLLIYPNE